MRLLVALLVALASPTPPAIAGAAGCGSEVTCLAATATQTAADTYRGFVWLGTRTFYDVARRHPAGCADCTWSTEDACTAQLEAGDQPTCVGGQLACPPHVQQRLLYLADAGGPRSLVDTWCPTEAGQRGPPTLDLAAAERAASAEVVAPLPAVGTSPPAAAVVNLPTWLWVRLPAAGPRAVVAVPGDATLRLELTLAPGRLHWDLGDGAAIDTDDPGAPWPDGRVRHTWTAEGVQHLAVTQVWRGTARLLTPFGPLPVPPASGPFTSVAVRDLPVRSLQAVLVPG